MTPLLHAVMAATLASSGVAASEPLAERFDVLGLQVCLGAVDDAEPCDLRLFAPQASRASSAPVAETSEPAARSPVVRHEPRTMSAAPRETIADMGREPRATPKPPELEPLEISLLGRTVCLGHVAGDASCDVTLFPRQREEVQG